ncbi:MAG: DUF1343 domain-containing protein [Candidatus Latescibacterota bacterium]
MLRLGNERLFDGEYLRLIEGRRVGLLTNHSGVDRLLRATADRLYQSGVCQLVALFGPEHGIRGDAPDGAQVGSGRDPHTGIPTYSLYGDTRAPQDAMLADVEVMLCDLQDVGVRFYTYLYTMGLSMQACAGRGIPFVVLDRPNPIGGQRVAGNVLDPTFASFVGLYPIPIQPGMTIGELARLFNAEFGLGADLHVVPMAGWRREMLWDATGLAWVPPSPNMPTLDTALVYPGMCFCEGTNLSEGRGTTRPFEQIGAPFVDGGRLAAHLNDLELPGVRFRPVFFRPTASKHAGLTCQGIQVHLTERQAFQPVRTGFEVLAAARRLHATEFAWLPASDEGGMGRSAAASGRPLHRPLGRLEARPRCHFDRLAGTDRVRLGLEEGLSVGVLEASWEEDLRAFERRRRPCLLY